MTANKVIERVDAIRPNSYSDEQKLIWISDLEGMVQRLVIQSKEIKTLSYPEDMDKELLIPAPYENVYNLYLESMIDYYNREYGNYNNSAMMFETRFSEYKKAYIRDYTVRTPASESATTPHDKQEIIDAVLQSLRNVTPAKIGEVTLLASKWSGKDQLYSQVVTVDGVTENSQVDLTPSVEQLSIFHHKDLAFVTENEGGVVTVYAIGQKPENDYNIQVTITEVMV